MTIEIEIPFDIIRVFEDSDYSSLSLEILPNYILGSYRLSTESLKVWDKHSGKVIRKYNSEDGFITNIFNVFNNNKYLVIGHDSNVIKVYEISSGKEFKTFNLSNVNVSDLKYLSVSKCEKFAATIDDDNTIYLYQLNNFTLLQKITNYKKVLMTKEIKFSPDSKYLAENNETINIWDVNTGNLVKQLPHFAIALAFSPDGKYLISADSEYQVDKNPEATEDIKVWDTETWSEIKSITDKIAYGAGSSYFHSLEFTPGGEYIVATYFETLKIFDFKTGEIVKRLPCRAWKPGLSEEHICYNDNYKQGLKLFKLEIMK